VRKSILFFVLAGCLIVPAAASATTRYAAPGGTAADTVCVTPDAPKCSIGAAAGGPNVLGADEAVILPGEYSDTAGDLDGDAAPNSTDHVVQPTAASVHGAAGQPRPVITLNSDTFYGAFLLGSGTLSDVEIVTSASTSDFTTVGTATVDRVVARSSKDNAIVCNQSQGTIRDTACLSSGSGGAAIGASTFIGGTFTVNVRNVTAIATGSSSYGAFYFYGTASPPVGPTITISAKSLIAQGTSQDVRVRALATGTSVTMNLDHSDYDTAVDEDVSGGAASVTAPGTGNNITGVPTLAADGYHELSGSPTINAGATDGSSGATDIDGQLRSIGTADIGADELGNVASTAVACSPGSVTIGSATTCTATVTDPVMGNPTPTGTVSFSSDTAGGSFGSGSCILAMVVLGQSSCQGTYSPGALGTGTHTITGTYSGDTVHDVSQGTTALTVTAPPQTPLTTTAPPTTGTSTDCSALRKKLRKAKRALRAARAAGQPTSKLESKVKKLRLKLRRLGC
jgi:hypothetical protein